MDIYRKIAYLSGMLLGCMSCYHYADIQIDAPAPHAVLNAIVCPDSLLRVNLSRPQSEQGGTGHASAFIEDAEVLLYLNGKPEGRLEKELGAGWYRMPGFRPAVGDRIEISARTPDYGVVAGETWIPGKTTIQAVDTASRHVVGMWGYEWDDLEISVRMRDLAGEQNFYLLSVSPKRIWQKGNLVVDADTLPYGYWAWSTVAAEEDSPLENGDMERAGFLNSFYQGFLLTDEGRDGQELTLKLTISNPQFSYRDPTISCRNYCRISLSSISKSYYLYRRSKALQKEQNDILGEAGLREPIPTYSNIRNGYGLVASRQEVVYELEFPYHAEELPYGNPFATSLERADWPLAASPRRSVGRP